MQLRRGYAESGEIADFALQEVPFLQGVSDWDQHYQDFLGQEKLTGDYILFSFGRDISWAWQPITLKAQELRRGDLLAARNWGRGLKSQGLGLVLRRI